MPQFLWPLVEVLFNSFKLTSKDKYLNSLTMMHLKMNSFKSIFSLHLLDERNRNVTGSFKIHFPLKKTNERKTANRRNIS